MRSGACPWARRANPNASPEPPLRPLNATDLALKTGSRHRQARSHTAHGKAPGARHFDTHATEPPRGTRAEIERARHSPHLCAAPAPGSTRSPKLALLCCTRCQFRSITIHPGRRSSSRVPMADAVGHASGGQRPTSSHASQTRRAAVVMGGHTALSTNRQEAEPQQTGDAADAGSVDAAHGRPVTVRQGSGHMCVCRRVRAEPEPQPAG